MEGRRSPHILHFVGGLEPQREFAGTIPFLLFALLRAQVCHHHTGLIMGSMAGRVRFRAYILFMVLFALIVYPPLCRMTWHPDGLLAMGRA